MKKTFILIAAVCAALASCTKNNGYLDGNGPAPEIDASDIKLNINIAEIGGGTKAAKTGWVEGDKINIWFDDLDVISLMGDNKGRAELVLTYTSGKWVAVFDEFYKTHTDGDNKFDGLFHTIKENGVLNCLYEGSNNISNYYVAVAGYEYTFTPGKWIDDTHIPNNTIPLMCCANVAYSYNSVTKTVTANIRISDWTMLTMIQVVVAGLDNSKASSYTLSCNNMYNLTGVYINGVSGVVYALAPNDTNYPTSGVSNADGVAFCFYDVWDDSANASFMFTLKKDGGSTKTYTTTQTLATDSEVVKFIKISEESFE